MLDKTIIDLFKVPSGKHPKLKHRDTDWEGPKKMHHLSDEKLKEQWAQILDQSQKELEDAQTLVYADDRYAVLMILQAMDTAGKDGTIKHVMSGVNPQGCQVFSFKKPSVEELDHTFLWRYMKSLPERGRIGIFNRSYYEDVLVVKVHPDLLGRPLDRQHFGKKFWKARYQDINSFERHLVRNGTLVLKIFLHISKDEQKKRLLERIDNPDKNWKFSSADLIERGFWSDYTAAYEEAIYHTSTDHAPWYVIPADHKWAARAVVADILSHSIHKLDLAFPKLGKKEHRELANARRKLMAEN